MKKFKTVLILLLCFIIYASFMPEYTKTNVFDSITMENISSLYSNSRAVISETSYSNINIREEMKSKVLQLMRYLKLAEPAKQTKIFEEIQYSLHQESILLGIGIGDTEDKIRNLLGEPNRRDSSKYGFQWYIYNEDYMQYLQIGIENGLVVGLYTNALQWEFNNGLKMGDTQNKVHSLLNKPLEYIRKGNTLYYLNDVDYTDTFFIDNYYITIFYDIYNDNRITAIKIIDQSTEEKLLGFYGEKSQALRESYERQIFDLTNVVRVQNNKDPLQWDDIAAVAAIKHSKDMAERNFFDHINPNGRGPSERITDEGINWQNTGENIAAGQTSAIFAHEAWMNSKGHRENILGDFTELGVGIHFGGDYNIYYTQNFYTPR